MTGDSEYVLNRTSRATATTADVPLRETETTRLIFRPQVVVNQHDPAQCVEGHLIHQRRRSKNAPWDASTFSLATLRSDQAVRLALNTKATAALYEALADLYAIGSDGIPARDQKSNRYVKATAALHEASADLHPIGPDGSVEATDGVVQGRQMEILQGFLKLLKEEGNSAWEYIEQLRPGLLQSVMLRKQHDERSMATKEFENHLAKEDWPEPKWQEFFENNVWIFGHNLAYQFLHLIEAKPQLGVPDVSRKGGQQGDYLLASEASAARFTVIVEIKTPQAALLVSEQYRSRTYAPGSQLIGGVAQLQSGCHSWATQGSRQRQNEQKLEKELGAHTYDPKGFLIIGNTKQLDAPDKKASFELFRRSLHNPEIVTFDELFARAQFTIANNATTRPREPDGTLSG